VILHLPTHSFLTQSQIRVHSITGQNTQRTRLAGTSTALPVPTAAPPVSDHATVSALPTCGDKDSPLSAQSPGQVHFSLLAAPLFHHRSRCVLFCSQVEATGYAAPSSRPSASRSCGLIKPFPPHRVWLRLKPTTVRGSRNHRLPSRFIPAWSSPWTVCSGRPPGPQSPR
jgi:hypothetical protein